MSETVTAAQIDAATSAVVEALRFADMCHRSILGERNESHSDAVNSPLIDLNTLPAKERRRIVDDLKKRQAAPEFQKYLAEVRADNLVCAANELHKRWEAVGATYTRAVANLIRPWKNKTRKTAHSVAAQYVADLCEVFRRACRNGFTRQEMLRVGPALVADIREFATVKNATTLNEWIRAESRQAKRSLTSMPKSLPDGPIPPDGFRFSGREVLGLAEDWLKVLTFVWERRENWPKWNDVAAHVQAFDRTAFDKLLDRIRAKLRKARWPETLEVFNSCVMLRKPERPSKAGRSRTKKSTAKAHRTEPAKSGAGKLKKPSARRREIRGGKK